MTQRICSLLTIFSVLLFPVIGTSAKPSCDSCGCDGKLKKVKRLMYVCEEVEIPCYACDPMTVFLPYKGKVERCEHRCDVNCRLSKTCGCKQKCSCKTVCSCQKTIGAKSTGRHCERCVRQPSHVKTYKVPVLKWVTVSVCCDGCDR